MCSFVVSVVGVYTRLYPGCLAKRHRTLSGGFRAVFPAWYPCCLHTGGCLWHPELLVLAQTSLSLSSRSTAPAPFLATLVPESEAERQRAPVRVEPQGIVLNVPPTQRRCPPGPNVEPPVCESEKGILLSDPEGSEERTAAVENPFPFPLAGKMMTSPLRRAQRSVNQGTQDKRRGWALFPWPRTNRSNELLTPGFKKLAGPRSGETLQKVVGEQHHSPQRRTPPPIPGHWQLSSKLRRVEGLAYLAHWERHTAQDLGSSCPIARRSAHSSMPRSCTHPPCGHGPGTRMWLSPLHPCRLV